MIYINSQWQGSGFNDILKFGVENIKTYFDNRPTVLVPLSNKPVEVKFNIIGYEAILEQISSFKTILNKQNPQKIATIAGDCGVELIPISYLNKKYDGNMAVIWLDAHADLNTPETSPSKTFHGMPLRTLLGDGDRDILALLYSNLKPKQICMLGVRDLDEPESQYIEVNSMPIFKECVYEKVKYILNNFKHVYIHLDLDVLDKSEYEHTMFPLSNGFKIKEVYDIILDIKKHHDVVGMCITESTAKNLTELEPIKILLDQVEI